MALVGRGAVALVSSASLGTSGTSLAAAPAGATIGSAEPASAGAGAVSPVCEVVELIAERHIALGPRKTPFPKSPSLGTLTGPRGFATCVVQTGIPSWRNREHERMSQ